MKKIKLALLAVIAVSMLTACSSQKNHENTAGTSTSKPTSTPAATATAAAGDNVVNDAENAVGDAAEGTGNVVGDAVEGAGDVVGDAAKDVGDAVNDTVGNMEKNQ